MGACPENPTYAFSLLGCWQFTEDGSGRDGLHYHSTSGVLRFDSSEREKSITVKLFNDNEVSDGLDFHVHITSPTAPSALGGAVLGITQRSTVTVATCLYSIRMIGDSFRPVWEQ